MSKCLEGSRILGEISREYGLMSARLLQADKGTITPEQSAKDAVESLKKISALKEKWNELCDGLRGGG